MADTLQIENWLDAANSGNLAMMKNIINGNPYLDINVTDRCGSSALHYASEEGRIELVKFLVEKGGIINAMNMWDKTPLHSACAKGHVEIVKYLVDHGARIEATSNKKGFTPLHLASQFNHRCIVEYLLENGADASAQAEVWKRNPSALSPVAIVVISV